MSPILQGLANGSVRGYGAFGAADPAQMEFIASAVGTNAQNTPITFSSIPSTYKDLVIVYTSQSPNNTNLIALNWRFNGDTGSNYYNCGVWYDVQIVDSTLTTSPTPVSGDTAAAQTQASAPPYVSLGAWGNIGTAFRQGQTNAGYCFINDYASTTTKKKLMGWAGQTWSQNIADQTGVSTGTFFWNSTAAINSITMGVSQGFTTNSVIYLYGIKG